MNVEHLDFKKITEVYQHAITAILGYLPLLEAEFLGLKEREETLSPEELLDMNISDTQLINAKAELEAKELFLKKYKAHVKDFDDKYAKEREQMRIYFEKIMRKARSLADNKDVHPEFRKNLQKQLFYYRPNFTEAEKINYFIAVRFEVENAQQSKRTIV